jgi:hypothetical protein
MSSFDTSGNPAACSYDPSTSLTNSGPFANVQIYPPYLSGTESARHSNNVWLFSYGSGGQNDLLIFAVICYFEFHLKHNIPSINKLIKNLMLCIDCK